MGKNVRSTNLWGLLLMAIITACAQETPVSIATAPPDPTNTNTPTSTPTSTPQPRDVPPAIAVENPTGFTGDVLLDVLVTDLDGNDTVTSLTVEQEFNPPATGNKEIKEYISNNDLSPFTVERGEDGHFFVKFTSEWPGRFPLHFTATDADGHVTTERIPIEIYWVEMPWEWRGVAIDTGFTGGTITLNVVPHLVDIAIQHNMNTILLSPHWIMDGQNDFKIYSCQDIPNTENNCLTPSDSEIEKWIDYAHQQGLSVILAPHINCTEGCLPYDIHPASWTQWFSGYSDLVYRMATIAEEHTVEAFSIGDELVIDQKGEWEKVLAGVMDRYHGQITYMDFHYWTGGDTFPIEAQLDFIGANFFPPATNEGNFDPTIEEMDKFMMENMDQVLLPHIQNTGKPAVATSLGHSPHDGTGFDPWSAFTSPVDNQEQIDWYESAFRYASRRLSGVIVWTLNTSPNSDVWEKGFDIRGKPVMDMIRIWFYMPAA